MKVCAFGGTMPRGVPTARQPGFSPPLPFTSLRFFFRELSPTTPTSSEFTSRDPPLRGGYALPGAPEAGASPVHQKGGSTPGHGAHPGCGRQPSLFLSLSLAPQPRQVPEKRPVHPAPLPPARPWAGPEEASGGARPRHLPIDGQAQWDGPTPRAHLLTGGDLGGVEAGGGLPPSIPPLLSLTSLSSAHPLPV